MDTEKFIEEAQKIHKKKYSYHKSNYIKKGIKITIGCSLHGDFTQTPKNHLNGHGCKYCGWESRADKYRLSKKDFINRANTIHGNLYDYSKSNYINFNYKLEIICKLHGSFWISPELHFKGSGCQKCGKMISQPERKIIQILDKYDMEYEFQKIYSNLKGKTKNSRLRYDFYLSKYNLLIEYDGIHHFEPMTKWRNIRYTKKQAIKNLKETQKRDRIKDEYAKNNNINLIRITDIDENKLINIINSYSQLA